MDSPDELAIGVFNGFTDDRMMLEAQTGGGQMVANPRWDKKGLEALPAEAVSHDADGNLVLAGETGLVRLEDGVLSWLVRFLPVSQKQVESHIGGRGIRPTRLHAFDERRFFLSDRHSGPFVLSLDDEKAELRKLEIDESRSWKL